MTVQKDLLGYWPLNTDDFKCVTPFTLDATSTGGSPTQITGKAGNGYNFTGSEHLETTDDVNVLALQEHTVMVWIRPDNVNPSTPQIIISRMSDLDTGGYEFSVRDGGIAYAYNDGSIQGWFEETNTPLNVDQWYHVGYNWSPSRGTVRFFIDGTMTQEVSTPSNNINHVQGDEFFIANQPDNDKFDGDIDDVRIYRGVQGESVFDRVRQQRV